MIIPPILTTSISIHFSFRGWKNALFELEGSDVTIRIAAVSHSTWLVTGSFRLVLFSPQDTESLLRTSNPVRATLFLPEFVLFSNSHNPYTSLYYQKNPPAPPWTNQVARTIESHVVKHSETTADLRARAECPVGAADQRQQRVDAHRLHDVFIVAQVEGLRNKRRFRRQHRSGGLG